MNSKLVSILIPTWNRGFCIEKAINSALNQTWENIEIIISDNNSSDNTEYLVNILKTKHDNIIYHKNSENIGAINNWKKCFNLASGEFIKILWSDDWLESNTIEKLIDPMLKDKNIAFTICRAELHDTNHKFVKNMYSDLKTINQLSFALGFALRKPHLPYSPLTALIKQEFVKNAFENYTQSSLCYNKAIGLDLIIIYNALINENYRGEFVKDTHVNLYEANDSITCNSDKLLLNSCYEKSIQMILINSKFKSIYSLLRILRHYFDKKNSRLDKEDLTLLRNNLSIKNLSQYEFITVFTRIFKGKK